MKWCLLFRIAATNDYVYIFEFEKNSKKEAAILSGEIKANC